VPAPLELGRIALGGPAAGPPNRLVLGDNLAFLRTLEDACVDLAYLDPPFFTRSARGRPGGGHSFDDRWPDGLDGYLDWLDDRLAELHRVLRPTGSLFLHLDWRAAHHGRVLLDARFGAEQFRNEIVWHYGLGGRAPAGAFARKHDTLLFYARSERALFFPLRGAVTPAMEAKYAHRDDRGRYMRSYGRRYYLQGGKHLDSVWDVPAIAPRARERVGYPTQKPEALLERVVLCASRPGALVADVCLGSGTTAVVAQRLGRRFLGCDRSAGALALARDRLLAAADAGPPAPDLLVERVTPP
jgi:site-specific DNA-methyltransferase (adenine-specific)